MMNNKESNAPFQDQGDGTPSTEIYEVDWDLFNYWMDYIYDNIKGENIDYVYGVPRGGLIPAVILSHALNVPLLQAPMNPLKPNTLVVEDVIDTGHSIRMFEGLCEQLNLKIVSLVRKPWAPKIFYAACETNKWITLPWEKK